MSRPGPHTHLLSPESSSMQAAVSAELEGSEREGVGGELPAGAVHCVTYTWHVTRAVLLICCKAGHK